MSPVVLVAPSGGEYPPGPGSTNLLYWFKNLSLVYCTVQYTKYPVAGAGFLRGLENATHWLTTRQIPWFRTGGSTATKYYIVNRCFQETAHVGELQPDSHTS